MQLMKKKKVLSQIDEECDLLIKTVEENEQKLKEVKIAVDTYSNKKSIDEDIDNIKNEIDKAKKIDANNLTKEENEKLVSYINILEKLLKDYVENPKTNDNISTYIFIYISSLLGLVMSIYFKKRLING